MGLSVLILCRICANAILFVSFLSCGNAQPNGSSFSPPAQHVGLWKSLQSVLRGDPTPSIQSVPFLDEDNFMAGRPHAHISFWRDCVLAEAEPEVRSRLLSWLQDGYRVPDLFGKVIDGIWVSGPPPRPARYPNRVPEAFAPFVDAQLASALASGALKRFVSSADCPLPHTILAMSIEETKPRLITDARPLNLHTAARPFSLENLGRVPDVVLPGEFMGSIDHKSGYHHFLLHPNSWKYFGVFWRGQYYVWTVFTFGYALSPWVYTSFSDAIVKYVRRLGVPCLSWIDDFLVSGLTEGARPSERDFLAAGRRSIFILAAVTVLAGYFVGRIKSVLEPTRLLRYLGFFLDSGTRSFIVPPDKRDKFLSLVRAMLAGGRKCKFRRLEKVMGKAVSLSFAVPAARMLSRALQHDVTAALRRSPLARNRDDWVPLSDQSLADLREWLGLAAHLNGGPWLHPKHTALRVVRVESDASGRRWGVVFEPLSPSGHPVEVVCAAAEFSLAEAQLHINEKEMLAVIRGLLSLLHQRGPAALKGYRFDLWLDNAAAVSNFNKCGGPSVALTAYARELFRLQLQWEFHCSFHWWSTSANLRADRLSRENAMDDAHLHALIFTDAVHSLCAGRNVAVAIDFMASPHSAQSLLCRRLPFVSRYLTGEELAVDLFSHDPAALLRLSSSGAEGVEPIGYCFPPAVMRAAVLSFLRAARSQFIVILPVVPGPYWPMVACASRAQYRFPSPAQLELTGGRVFSAPGLGLAGADFETVPLFSWVAVLVDFSAFPPDAFAM